MKLCCVLACLAALTGSAEDSGRQLDAPSGRSVSRFVPTKDPFSSGQPTLEAWRGSTGRPLAIIRDLPPKAKKVGIEVKMMVGDFWLPGEFEQLYEQRRRQSVAD